MLSTTKHFLLSLIIVTLFSGSFISCKKYADGGLVGNAEKRLTANGWQLSQYLRNSNDETNQLLITNFSETFAEGGTLTRSYNDKDGDPFSETGTWAFDNDK